MKRMIPTAILGIMLLLAGVGRVAASDLGFTDIAGLAQENAIVVICDQGLMKGVDAQHFVPAGHLTRAQLAVILQRAFEFDGGTVELPEGMYQDIPADSWYAAAVRAGAANGVFAYAAEFRAGQTVERIELAACLQQAFTARRISIPMTMQYPVFEDAGDLSSEEMMAAVFVNNTGIMPGEDNVFRPHDPVTRAEMAQMLLTIVKLTAVTEGYDGSYQLSPGQSVVVSLPATAGTGYQWTLSEWDQTVLSLVSENYMPSGSEMRMVGQSGDSLWKFKAEQAGTVELKFSYARPWESSLPLESMVLTVEVNDPGQRIALGSIRIVSQSPYIEGQLVLPVIRGMQDAAAQDKLNRQTQAQALAYYEEVKGWAMTTLEEVAAADLGYSFTPCMDVNFTPGRVDEEIISYYQDLYQYMGGAHGMTVRTSATIDAAAGAPLKLADFFVSGYDYTAAINAEISRQIAADTETYYFETGSSTIAADADNFYVTAQGLVFYYQQYELAPYAAGILEYAIPYELLAEGLKP